MNMMTDVTGVTGERQVTGVTGAAKVTGERQVAVSTPIDRTNEKLIDNSTTFNALLRILATNPEVLVNAKAEAEEREAQEKEEKLRKTYGADYDLVFDKKKVNSVKPRRPGVRQLRSGAPRVAVMEMPRGGICEVYVNGYAVYDNGNRRVVIWVPDCGTATYYFTGLKDKEKEYLVQSDEIGMDVIGELPWYDAILIAGEDRIQYNMDHPKSKGNTSDYDMEDVNIAPAARWIGGSRFDNPETAYLKKEAAEERRNLLTYRQREVYEMYFEQGNTTRQIAGELNIQFPAVSKMVARIKNRIAENVTENDF